MDKEKKKSIGVYIGLVICFILFSIFVFSKKDSNNTENTINKKIESNIIESDNNDKNTSSTKISDEENIQNESDAIDFIKNLIWKILFQKLIINFATQILNSVYSL